VVWDTDMIAPLRPHPCAPLPLGEGMGVRDKNNAPRISGRLVYLVNMNLLLFT